MRDALKCDCVHVRTRVSLFPSLIPPPPPPALETVTNVETPGSAAGDTGSSTPVSGSVVRAGVLLHIPRDHLGWPLPMDLPGGT